MTEETTGWQLTSWPSAPPRFQMMGLWSWPRRSVVPACTRHATTTATAARAQLVRGDVPRPCRNVLRAALRGRTPAHHRLPDRLLAGTLAGAPDCSLLPRGAGTAAGTEMLAGLLSAPWLPTVTLTFLAGIEGGLPFAPMLLAHPACTPEVVATLLLSAGRAYQDGTPLADEVVFYLDELGRQDRGFATLHALAGQVNTASAQELLVLAAAVLAPPG